MSFDNIICNTINGLPPGGGGSLTLSLNNTSADSFIPLSTTNGSVAAMTTTDKAKIDSANNKATFMGTQLVQIPGTLNGIDLKPAAPLQFGLVYTLLPSETMTMIANGNSAGIIPLEIIQGSSNPLAELNILNDAGTTRLKADNVIIEQNGGTIQIKTLGTISQYQVLSSSDNAGTVIYRDLPSYNSVIPWTSWNYFVLLVESTFPIWVPADSQNGSPYSGADLGMFPFDYGNVTVILPRSTTYRFTVSTKLQDNLGIFQFTIGSNTELYDAYDAAITQRSHTWVWTLLAGPNIINLSVQNKNVSSSEYWTQFIGDGLSICEVI